MRATPVAMPRFPIQSSACDAGSRSLVANSYALLLAPNGAAVLLRVCLPVARGRYRVPPVLDKRSALPTDARRPRGAGLWPVNAGSMGCLFIRIEVGVALPGRRSRSCWLPPSTAAALPSSATATTTESAHCTALHSNAVGVAAVGRMQRTACTTARNTEQNAQRCVGA